MQDPPRDASSSEPRTISVGSPTSSGGRFRVLRIHEKGGVGQVSVAIDEELQREVALKELQDFHADDPASRERFVMEAEITGRLEHPGIVPVYGLGFHPDGRPFYAMRFIQGETLRETVRRFHKGEGIGTDPGDRLLARNQLLRRFITVCDAVHYAHSRGIVHRDIKPGNILLGPYGETLLVDWGFAKLISEKDRPPTLERKTPLPMWDTRQTATHTGAFVGTPQYTSPEQAAGRLADIGPRSDIFSLGATLFTILTDQSPFEGRDIGDVLEKVQLGKFPKPTQLNNRVPKLLEAICLQAMALYPEDRYTTARELAQDIERFLINEPVSAAKKSQVKRHRPPSIRIRIFGDKGLLFASDTLVGPVEIGRKRDDLEEVFSTRSVGDRVRLVIVGREFEVVSRQQVLLIPRKDGTLQIENLGRMPIQIGKRRILEHKGVLIQRLPVNMVLRLIPENRRIIVEDGSRKSTPALIPEDGGVPDSVGPPGKTPVRSPPSQEEYARWVGVVVTMMQSTTNYDELFHETARAVLGMVDLDLVSVLLVKDGLWKTKSVQTSKGDTTGVSPRRSVLDKVLKDKCAVWQTPTQEEDGDWSSIQDMIGIVAGPILDNQGTVIGAIYGERNITSLPSSFQMKLESMFIGFVAALVGTRIGSTR
jgi:serine/threonine protein kinase